MSLIKLIGNEISFNRLKRGSKVEVSTTSFLNGMEKATKK